MIYTVSSIAEFVGFRDEIRKNLAFLCQAPDERLFIAVNEAVNNALLHGIQEKSGKQVQIILERDEEGLSVTIRHNGKGIRRRKTSNNPDEIWAENGRGLSIIRHFTDSAEYNLEGNELVLRRRLS